MLRKQNIQRYEVATHQLRIYNAEKYCTFTERLLRRQYNFAIDED